VWETTRDGKKLRCAEEAMETGNCRQGADLKLLGLASVLETLPVKSKYITKCEMILKQLSFIKHSTKLLYHTAA
jgi:hypothetical protein